jgi:hypothetical protein
LVTLPLVQVIDNFFDFIRKFEDAKFIRSWAETYPSLVIAATKAKAGTKCVKANSIQVVGL